MKKLQSVMKAFAHRVKITLRQCPQQLSKYSVPNTGKLSNDIQWARNCLRVITTRLNVSCKKNIEERSQRKTYSEKFPNIQCNNFCKFPEMHMLYPLQENTLIS